jgi:hypothetical protein
VEGKMKVEVPYTLTDDLVGKKVVASTRFEDYKTLEVVLMFDGGSVLYYRTSTHFEDHFILCNSLEELNLKVEDISSKISDFCLKFLLQEATSCKSAES